MSASGSGPLGLKLPQVFPRFIPASSLSPVQEHVGSDKGLRDSCVRTGLTPGTRLPKMPAWEWCYSGPAPLHTWGALLGFQEDPQSPQAQHGWRIPQAPQPYTLFHAPQLTRQCPAGQRHSHPPAPEPHLGSLIPTALRTAGRGWREAGCCEEPGGFPSAQEDSSGRWSRVSPPAGDSLQGYRAPGTRRQGLS